MADTPETTDQIPDDGALLSELLDDMDAFTGMVERTRAAVAKGKPDVRLVPRGKARTIAAALDDIGDAMTRRTLQVRAQRAIRDGVPDAKLSAILDELAGEDEDAS